MELDLQDFRQTMGSFASGIVIVTGMDARQPLGFAAQSFISLSLEPALICFSPAKTSSTWPKIRDSGVFGINVLAADQTSVCQSMASSGGDKFAGVEWRPGQLNVPILEGVLAYIECSVEAEHEAGDHTLVIGRVASAARVRKSMDPLLYFRSAYGTFAPS